MNIINNNNSSIEINRIDNDKNTTTNNQFFEEVLRDVISGDFDNYLSGYFNNNNDEESNDIEQETGKPILNGQTNNEHSEDDDDQPNEYDNIEDMMYKENTNLLFVEPKLDKMKYFTCSMCHLLNKKDDWLVLDECGHEFCEFCSEEFFYHWNLDCLVDDCDGTLSEKNIRLLFEKIKIEMRKEKQKRKVEMEKMKQAEFVKIIAPDENEMRKEQQIIEQIIEATFVKVVSPPDDEHMEHKADAHPMHKDNKHHPTDDEEVDAQTVLCQEKIIIDLDGFADDLPVISNISEFECKICFTDCKPYEGIILRSCLHSFCLDCMRQFLRNDENLIFECPNVDEMNIKCDGQLEEREIRSILPQKEFKTYMTRLTQFNLQTIEGSVQCSETNCTGIFISEDGDKNFICPKCSANNCITCKAIHRNMTCEKYKMSIDPNLRSNVEYLKKRKADGFAMDCPNCGAIVEKVDGCDGMKCIMCTLDLCWATKGRRWGPNGKGDTSAGCGCTLWKRCTPTCNNCH